MKRAILSFLICLGVFILGGPIAKAASISFYGTITTDDGCVYKFNGIYDTETGHGQIIYDGGPCGHGHIFWRVVPDGGGTPEPVEPVADWAELEGSYEVLETSGDLDVLLECFNEAASDPTW